MELRSPGRSLRTAMAKAFRLPTITTSLALNQNSEF